MMTKYFRQDWTFSNTAEMATGVMLVATIALMLFV
jgi:hypothetical protein